MNPGVVWAIQDNLAGIVSHAAASSGIAGLYEAAATMTTVTRKNNFLTSREWGRGAKAGLVAGGIWGVITAVETAVALSPVGTVLILAILRVAWGFILGLVFAAVVDRLMSTRTYRTRGVIYGLILGVVEVVLNLGGLATGLTGLAVNSAVGVLSSLVFGYVLGYSYERFAPTPLLIVQEPSVATR